MPREIRIAVVRLVDKRLKRERLRLQRHGGRAGSDSRSTGDARYRSTVLDSMCNFQGKFLAIRRILRVLRFGRVGKKPAFHQHGGNPRVSQNKKSATSDSAIRRGRAAGHVIMNRRGQWQTLRAIKISFDSARTRARGRVEMNADKNCVSIRVGDGDAGTERNKDVAVSRHCNAITVRLKYRVQSMS